MRGAENAAPVITAVQPMITCLCDHCFRATGSAQER
eukprot:CAMPEP_0174746128 /NCGR_PEP_ID=MMETSP1094-20130205/88394_1 /TAXON_ID=156173 /ORGANISM="Chrysochromulina brevifilum, Strain UTEX LB 985" /LENGTH=35 /DNA_ID= /DNA_START= /DNA_END= /DNA_ORIENTATION=